MQLASSNVPPPDLRIVRIDTLHPHEEHDIQRSAPLIERLRIAEHIINPPVVAPIGASQFVVMDGANRMFAMRELDYPHVLVQVVTYDSGFVELGTWKHIVAGWQPQALVDHISQLDDVEMVAGLDSHAVAHIILLDGRVIALRAPISTSAERNTVLRHIVQIYASHAHLYRTAISEPDEIWPLYPDGIALVIFPDYTPADIIAAAKYQAYLPPGISRHIIHGRALKVNYPTDQLKDRTIRLPDKNEMLRDWMQQRLATRQVRYYAESTFHFDE